ncbi:hypothetical protein [uncultured Clostridium sp.]|uniref:hypothetical protein n=1 Tax=uncultured Clostridium sp. TaxID=59620 RepID=UPI0028EA7324|nr:hypothetical protein [uncultured Clostridium sp.]
MGKGKVTENIMEYMNSMEEKQFSYEEVSAIANSIKEEFYDRKYQGLVIKTRTKDGKNKLNQRVAAIANKKLNNCTITAHDVWRYKRCFAEEYTNRTGKCAWGFKEVRERLGFDRNTGLEIV